MLSRRIFLLSSFAVPALSLLQRTALGEDLLSSKVLVLSENNCVDTNAFSTCLPASYIETDPSSILLELDRGFREGEYELVFGLTRDSNFVLVEQYAQAASYRLHYQGIHQYNARGLSHKLTADKNVVAELTNQIQIETENWTRTIGRVPVLSSYENPLLVSADLQTDVHCPLHGPGQLVSWLFKRNLA